MRQRSPQEIMNANIWVPIELGGSPWRPVIDSNDKEKFYTFLENSPQILRNSGKFYNISVMIGVTSEEGSYAVSKRNLTLNIYFSCYNFFYFYAF
jgi:hypothetical protein